MILKIIFAGSSNISALNLEFVLKEIPRVKILSVFTNNFNNPVEILCRRYNLIIYNNLHNKEIISIIKGLNPHLIIVIAYGQILSAKILSIPTFGCINVHFSKLPRWRGAAPIQRAIIANDKMTGISIIKMNTKLDHGPIIFNSCIKNEVNNTITLTNHLNNLSKKGLLILLNKFLNKENILSVHQNLNYSTSYARKISKEETRLKWWYPSFYLVRYIKALIPAPTTFFYYKNMRIKVWEANAFYLNIDEEKRYLPGQIIYVDKNGIKIATGLGILNITKLQFPGKRPITSMSFFNSTKHSIFFTIKEIIE